MATVLHPYYSKEEIVQAFRKYNLSTYAQEKILDYLKDDHMCSDSDTITVKELREALKRMFPADCCLRCGSKFHGNDDPADSILDNIREHREPDYPSGSIWKDADGWVWQRLSSRTWWRIASDRIFGNDAPVRPLKRMDVV